MCTPIGWCMENSHSIDIEFVCLLVIRVIYVIYLIGYSATNDVRSSDSHLCQFGSYNPVRSC